MAFHIPPQPVTKMPVIFIGSSHMSPLRGFQTALNKHWYASSFNKSNYIHHPNVEFLSGRKYGRQFNFDLPGILQLFPPNPSLLIVSLGDNNIDSADHNEAKHQVLSSLRNLILKVAVTPHCLVVTGIQTRWCHSIEQITLREELNARIYSLITTCIHQLKMHHRLHYLPMRDWFLVEGNLQRRFFANDGAHLSPAGAHIYALRLLIAARDAATEYQNSLNGRLAHPPTPLPMPTIYLPTGMLPRLLVQVPMKTKTQQLTERPPPKLTLPPPPAPLHVRKSPRTAKPKISQHITIKARQIDVSTQTLPEGAGVSLQGDELVLKLGNDDYSRPLYSKLAIFKSIPCPLSPIPAQLLAGDLAGNPDMDVDILTLDDDQTDDKPPPSLPVLAITMLDLDQHDDNDGQLNLFDAGEIGPDFDITAFENNNSIENNENIKPT